uniref:t-SNARE coiled-coil homology domain-containing protein n=1 Tax=Setaria digitata TaxID=48799 RepID=A0A915PNM6_9BILA
MFRKVKSRSNLRQRVLSDDDGDDDDGGGGDGSSGAVSGTSAAFANKGTSVSRTVKHQQQQHAEKVNKAEGNQEPQAGVVTEEHHLLSFDNFEGDDITDFKIKRKDPNKRLEKLSKRAKLRQKIENEVTEDETKVVIKQMKPNIKLEEPSMKNLYIQSSHHWEVKKEAEQEERGTEPDSVIRNKFPSAFRGEIPDAKTVYEARKKREKMRLVGSNGQIPLDDVQRLKDKSVARSRLIREDENDLSDEDPEDGRFYSLKALAADDDERRRNDHMDFLAHEGGENDDDREQSDDEVTRWEKEQMKKGVSSHKVEMLERERAKMEAVMKAIRSSMELPSENREQLPMEMDIDFSGTDVLSASQVGRVSGQTTAVSLKGIISRLQQRKKDGKESLNAREAEFEKANMQIQENKEMISKLEMEEPQIRERFQVYQDMRAYARDLLECLSEKINEVKDLESRMAEILDGRARKLRTRRRNDVHDMYDECSAAAAGRPLHQRAPEILQRAAEREARRQDLCYLQYHDFRSRRRRMRENTLEGVSHEEGLSTDDEETNSEIVARQQSINEIRAAANVVFVDALDDFCRIDRILSRFVDWLARDEESFTSAYIHLCIPKLISLFIRLELLDWGPLENDNHPVNSMRWYEDLITCAAASSNINTEHPVVVSFVPLCIEKVVLWKVIDLVRERWDPLSQHQCRNLGILLNQLIDECPTLVPSSRSVQKLLQTICLRAQDAIDEDLFVPIYSKQAVENLATGCKAFLDRQTWTSVKLIRCLSCLSSVLSEEKMRELVLDGIVNRMMPALQCATISDQSMIRKCRALMKLVPVAWREDGTRIALRNFNDLLGKVAEEHKNNRHLDICASCVLRVMDWTRAMVIIERFERMTKVNLRGLELLLLSIREANSLMDSVSLMSKKRDASEKIDQLLGGLQQVLNLRTQLNIIDRERFDDRIEPIRIQIQGIVNSLNNVAIVEASGENVYNDLYEKSLTAEATKGDGGELEGKQISSLYLQAEQAKMNAAEMRKLASDVEDLNEMMMQLAQLVHAQHEVVDSIEEHIEKTQSDVHEGHKNLKKAEAAKTAKYPMVAAVVGGVTAGGPVGFAAGSTIAGLFAAFGGAIAG